MHVRGIPEKSLNRMLLFLILKASHRRWRALENLVNFTGKYLCGVSSINLQPWGPEAFLKKTLAQVFFQRNFRNFWEHLVWRPFLNLCFCTYNSCKRYSYRGVIRIFSNIYDEVLLTKTVNDFYLDTSIIDTCCRGSKYASGPQT